MGFVVCDKFAYQVKGRVEFDSLAEHCQPNVERTI